MVVNGYITYLGFFSYKKHTMTVPNRAVSIAYTAHAPVRRGSAHMGAKQDFTETCATVNVGGVHRAVTGKWGIAASIAQLEDLGNCVKEHATKGV